MAGQAPVNASDLVLLTGTVLTQEHNLRKRQSVWHKINKLFSYSYKWFWAFEYPIYHYFHAVIRNIKYAINLIVDLAICYVPIQHPGGGGREALEKISTGVHMLSFGFEI